MGTPGFAVPSLRVINESHHQICGVVAGPDRKTGRGLKILSPPVKIAASEMFLPCIQPENLTEAGFESQLQIWKPDCTVVVAFRILPKNIFSIPEKGTINLHASYLPDYRGAAPINRVIMNGESKTGLTTFLIDEKVDTGKILLQKVITIAETETAGELSDRMSVMGADLIIETLDLLEQGELIPKSQPTGQYKRAPKISKDTCRIDWTKPAKEVYNLIRGLSPSPGAKTNLHKKSIKILRAKLHGKNNNDMKKPGTIVIADPKIGFVVQCGSGCIEILELMQEGRKPVPARAFLSGFRKEIVSDIFEY